LDGILRGRYALVLGSGVHFGSIVAHAERRDERNSGVSPTCCERWSLDGLDLLFQTVAEVFVDLFELKDALVSAAGAIERVS
jgi:hypothetical protein